MQGGRGARGGHGAGASAAFGPRAGPETARPGKRSLPTPPPRALRALHTPAHPPLFRQDPCFQRRPQSAGVWQAPQKGRLPRAGPQARPWRPQAANAGGLGPERLRVSAVRAFRALSVQKCPSSSILASTPIVSRLFRRIKNPFVQTARFMQAYIYIL